MSAHGALLPLLQGVVSARGGLQFQRVEISISVTRAPFPRAAAVWGPVAAHLEAQEGANATGKPR